MSHGEPGPDGKHRRGTAPLHLWDEAWLALHHEEVVDPARPIVDPHHHLWQISQPYFVEELAADLQSGHNLRGTVYVECYSMYNQDVDPLFASVGEVEFANGVGAMFSSGRYGAIRACAGIVGRVDLTQGAVAGGVLEAQIARAPSRFKGIRQLAGWDASPVVSTLRRPPPQGMMLDATFREGFAQLAPLGLSFDAQFYHPQIPEVIDLVDAFPDTTVILNHLGTFVGVGPYAANRVEEIARWKAGLAELARRPNTFMKIGGLSMRIFGFDFMDRDRPAPSAELAAAWGPLIETCIETFGPDRCMFESNFPVDKAGVSYRVMWNGYKRAAAGCSEDEKNALFAGTAVRAYRLPASLRA